MDLEEVDQLLRRFFKVHHGRDEKIQTKISLFVLLTFAKPLIQ